MEQLKAETKIQFLHVKKLTKVVDFTFLESVMGKKYSYL